MTPFERMAAFDAMPKEWREFANTYGFAKAHAYYQRGTPIAEALEDIAWSEEEFWAEMEGVA